MRDMWMADSHYTYLDKHLPAFFEAVGVPWEGNAGIIVAHGDKAYGYLQEWAEAGVPFQHGVALYILTYCSPFSREVRETPDGWVHPREWVVNNYERFKQHLAPIPNWNDRNQK